MMLSLTACTERPEATQQEACLKRERQGYPALERVATEALSDVAHGALRRDSWCQETGEPRGTLFVTVADWKWFKRAGSYFLARGWTHSGHEFMYVSPDRKYSANTMQSKDRNGVPYIDVHFRVYPDTINFGHKR
jgi:hypothetical protein